MALDRGLSADSRPMLYPSLLDIKKIYSPEENKERLRAKKWSPIASIPIIKLTSTRSREFHDRVCCELIIGYKYYVCV